MTNQGWIKIHRKLLDNPISTKPMVAWFFIYCLLKANHQDNKIIWNKKELVIKRGSFVSGLNAMSTESGISIQSIRTAFVILKSTNTLTIKSTTKFSVITILNYNQYQMSTSELTNKQQTTNKQTTTNNNIENVKNNNNKYTTFESLDELAINEISTKYGVPTSFVKSRIDDMGNWLAAKGKKYKDYKAALSNWVKSEAIKIKTNDMYKKFNPRVGVTKV